MPTKQNQNTAPAAVQAAESAANNGDFERLLAEPIRFDFGPKNFQEALQFADVIKNSQLVPPEYRGKKDDVFAVIQYGAELGLSAMQSINGIKNINGKYSVYGDIALGLVMSSPAYEWHTETLDEETMTATFIIKRRGHLPHPQTFSKADAVKAGLWDERQKVKRKNKSTNEWYEADNDSPWHRYPTRMLKMRARGFGMRDKFADRLHGIITVEEAMDYVDVATRGRTVAEKMQEDADYDAPQNRKTAQVYDATGTPVATDQITADQVDDLIAAITELATISGYEYAIALEKLSDWYASKRDGEVLPDLLDITAADYPAVLKRVQSWIKAVEKQNGRHLAETETAETESQPA